MQGRDHQTEQGAAMWLRRWWWVVLGGVIALGIALHLYVASVAAPLMEQANKIADAKDRITSSKDVLQYQTDNQIKIWTAIVQAAGAVVVAVGGYFAWSNLQVAQQNLQATQKKLDLDRETQTANRQATQEKLDLDREVQITNRLTQAIGQIGAEL